jgi:hypothetical protein
MKLKVPCLSLEAVNFALELLEREDASKAPVDGKDYVDSSLMQELEESGFIANLYK